MIATYNSVYIPVWLRFTGLKYSEESKVFNHGYSNLGVPKPVDCFDLDDNFIKRYDTLNEVAIRMGIGRSTLTSRFKKSDVIEASGFRWRMTKLNVGGVK